MARKLDGVGLRHGCGICRIHWEFPQRIVYVRLQTSSLHGIPRSFSRRGLFFQLLTTHFCWVSRAPLGLIPLL